MPPSRETVERVRAASERMRQAQEEHRAFVELPNRSFSAEDVAENDRLSAAVKQAIDDFWEAFNAAAHEDLASSSR